MDRVRRGDGGETLIEILISVVVMGLALTALLTGLLTASRTAAAHRDQADVSTYLIKAVEVIKGAAYTISCSQSAYQPLAGAVVPATATAKVTLTSSVEYWDSATSTFTGPCVDGTTAQGTLASSTTTSGFMTLTVTGMSPALATSMVGLQVKFTNGPAAGQSRKITIVDVAAGTVTTLGFANTPAAGNLLTIEHPDFEKLQRVTVTSTGTSGPPVKLSLIKRFLG